MNNRDILRMLSPLAFFVIHVIYLIAISKDHFLNKWVDGSFTFFVALVLCNIIRSRLVAQADQSVHDDEKGNGENNREQDSTP